jgi:hypothetical protein
LPILNERFLNAGSELLEDEFSSGIKSWRLSWSLQKHAKGPRRLNSFHPARPGLSSTLALPVKRGRIRRRPSSILCIDAEIKCVLPGLHAKQPCTGQLQASEAIWDEPSKFVSHTELRVQGAHVRHGPGQEEGGRRGTVGVGECTRGKKGERGKVNNMTRNLWRGESRSS